MRNLIHIATLILSLFSTTTWATEIAVFGQAATGSTVPVIVEYRDLDRATVEARIDWSVGTTGPTLQQIGRSIFAIGTTSTARFPTIAGKPDVRAVSKNFIHELDLNQIKATQLGQSIFHDTLDDALKAYSLDVVHSTGIRGSGSMAVVIDTGVDANHPFLRRKVIGETCMESTAGIPVDIFTHAFSSRCVTPKIPCSAQLNSDDCAHGTELAGIIAGRGVVGQSLKMPRSGVAPESRIYSINVAMSDSEHRWSLYVSDGNIIAALAKVVDLQFEFPNTNLFALIGFQFKDATSCDDAKNRGTYSAALESAFTELSTAFTELGFNFHIFGSAGDRRPQGAFYYTNPFTRVPGCYPGVRAVASHFLAADPSTDLPDFKLHPSSHVGEFVGPGVNIPTAGTANFFPTQYRTSTDIAAAFVTGAAMLYREASGIGSPLFGDRGIVNRIAVYQDNPRGCKGFTCKEYYISSDNGRDDRQIQVGIPFGDLIMAHPDFGVNYSYLYFDPAPKNKLLKFECFKEISTGPPPSTSTYCRQQGWATPDAFVDNTSIGFKSSGRRTRYSFRNPTPAGIIRFVFSPSNPTPFVVTRNDKDSWTIGVVHAPPYDVARPCSFEVTNNTWLVQKPFKVYCEFVVHPPCRDEFCNRRSDRQGNAAVRPRTSDAD